MFYFSSPGGHEERRNDGGKKEETGSVYIGKKGSGNGRKKGRNEGNRQNKGERREGKDRKYTEKKCTMYFSMEGKRKEWSKESRKNKKTGSIQ